jgi:hypothetical protein
MGWTYGCKACAQVFNTPKGVRGHKRKTGHKPKRLDRDEREVLKGLGRWDARVFLAEYVMAE